MTQIAMLTSQTRRVFYCLEFQLLENFPLKYVYFFAFLTAILGGLKTFSFFSPANVLFLNFLFQIGVSLFQNVFFQMEISFSLNFTQILNFQITRYVAFMNKDDPKFKQIHTYLVKLQVHNTYFNFRNDFITLCDIRLRFQN